MERIYLFPLIIALNLMFFSFAQEEEQMNLEYAKELTFKELTKIIGEVSDDTLMSKTYINLYINKAIEEKRVFEKAHGYTLLSNYEANTETKLDLLDKAISLTKEQDSKYFPMLPYFYKGSYYMSIEKYSKALESNIEALKYSRIKENVSYEYAAINNIAIIKGEIGREKEALQLFKKCLTFERNKKDFDQYAYSEALYYLARYSIRNNALDSAKVYIKDGLSRTQSRYPKLYYNLTLEEGTYNLVTGNYEAAKASYNKVLKNLTFTRNEYKRAIILAHFYLGRIKEKTGFSNQAITEYLTVDSLSNISALKPYEIRRGYIFLINSLKDENKKYEMVQKTLAFDSIITQNGMSVSNKIFKEFDTPELLNEKENLIKRLNSEKKGSSRIVYLTTILLGISGVAFYYQVNRRIKLKKKFELLLRNMNNNSDGMGHENRKKIRSRPENIPNEIIEQILDGLKKFEIKKEFLESEITLKKLADKLKTNVKYLSIVINDYKSKSFSNYLKDLRINYSIGELSSNEKLRTKYSIEGIAKEMGFKTSESFSSAFKSKTGLNPSYFIKELIKSEQN